MDAHTRLNDSSAGAAKGAKGATIPSKHYAKGLVFAIMEPARQCSLVIVPS